MEGCVVKIRKSSVLGGFLSLLAANILFAQAFTVVPAPEWNILFNRDSGWSGADGIYSIPLDGVETHGNYQNTNTIFLFSDTFIGDVSPDGERLPGTVMVNNTAAFLASGEPVGSDIHFIVAHEGGEPRSLFIPDTPHTQPGEWYWLMDGIHLNGSFYIFAARMRSDPVALFAREGLALIEIPAGSVPPFENHTQTELPFNIPADGDRGAIVYGGAIMPNTESSGAPFPDGFIYIYGIREDFNPGNKKVFAARVTEAEFPDPDSWRFYNGENWVPDVMDAAVLTDRVSSEFSMSPMQDGRYILAFQVDCIGPYVGFRIGDSPVGPFSPAQEIYYCPEREYAGIYTYNAKAHPHLSEPGELLISYNVNTTDFWAHFQNADIYRPRFIRLIPNTMATEGYTISWGKAGGLVNDSGGIRALLSGDSFKSLVDCRPGCSTKTRFQYSEAIQDTAPALSTCPNPFNLETVVTYSLNREAEISIDVYNIAGQIVASLENGRKAPGVHKALFNANGLPSGMYFIYLQIQNRLQLVRKVILAK